MLSLLFGLLVEVILLGRNMNPVADAFSFVFQSVIEFIFNYPLDVFS